MGRGIRLTHEDTILCSQSFFILLLHTIVNKRASIFEINVSCGCASLSGLSPKIFTLHAFAAYLNFAS
jgi:hypothetical protein